MTGPYRFSKNLPPELTYIPKTHFERSLAAEQLLLKVQHVQEQTRNFYQHSQEIKDASDKKHALFNSSIQLNQNSTPTKIYRTGYSGGGSIAHNQPILEDMQSRFLSRLGMQNHDEGLPSSILDKTVNAPGGISGIIGTSYDN